jgi:aspartokinase
LAEQSTAQPSKQEHNLFAVMGEKVTGRASALIVAATEADAEYYALQELGFITVSETILVSDAVHVGSADTRE